MSVQNQVKAPAKNTLSFRYIKYLILICVLIALIVGSVYYFAPKASVENKTNSRSVDTSLILEDAPEIWSYQTRNKVLSGEWSEEDFILNNLKFITGKSQDNQLNNQLEVDSINTTVRMAKAYLLNGQDRKIKDSITEYLSIIYPAEKNPANTITELNDIWGQMQVFASEETSTLEYMASDLPHRIDYPNDPALVGDSVEFVRSAIIDSYRKYSELGFIQKPSTILLQPTDLFSGRSAARVQASAMLNSDRTACNINIFSPFYRRFNTLSGAERDKLKQVIAHEVFHCVQDINYSGQLSHYVTNNGLYNAWNIEGGAEFFSNVVYPEYDLENEFNDVFDRTSSRNEIYKMSYEAYLFHQFLANNLGYEGLKSFYSAMSTSGRFNEQREALSAFEGMDELFHNFSKAYIDNKIRDTNGYYKSLSPRFDTVRTISETSQLKIRAKPFVVNREKHKFEFGNRVFNITTNSDPDPVGKYNIQKAESEIWEAMPSTLPQSPASSSGDTGDLERNFGGSDYCATGNKTSEEIKVVHTSTANTTQTHEITFDIIASGDSTNDGIANPANIDSRLIGSWRADEESRRRAAEQIVNQNAGAGTLVIDNFYYDSSICFERNGNFFADTTTDTNYQINFGDGDLLPASLTLFGSYFGNYTAESGAINYSITNQNEVGQYESFGVVTPFGNANPAVRSAIDPLLDQLTQRDPVTNLYSNEDLALRRRIRRAILESANPTTTTQSMPYRIEGNKLITTVPLSPFPEITFEKSN